VLKNENTIFKNHTGEEFLELCLQVFRFQFENNSIYGAWTRSLKIDPSGVKALAEIPYLPIEFFKNFEVVSSPIARQTVTFTSSATTSQQPSKHYVNKIEWYERSFLEGFRLFYGDPKQYCFLALLPNYLQRGGSSLVYMCDKLIRESEHADSGFFLEDTELLITKINSLKETGQKTILIGVSYALMDLCDRNVELDENFIVMETGGMKGRRKELLKPELHAYLKKGFKISKVHSEYGMTELLSQAYSQGDGLFRTPPWMKVLTREIDDPLNFRTDNRTGGINVIDLANLHSCSFIATKDLGRIHADGSLELMGRYDDSDVRGCNLMVDFN
jgi:hypothetical protein